MNRIMGRIVFYSASDLSSGGHLQDAEPILRGFVPEASRDINDVLELYNIKLYIESDCGLKSWTTKDRNNFKGTVKRFYPIIATFFAKIDETTFSDEYKKVDDELINSFWAVFATFRVYERVSAEQIKTELEKDNKLIDILLEHQVLVTAYDGMLAEFIRGNVDCIELLLSAYLLELDSHEKKPNIPKALSLADKDQLLTAFIDSDTPSISLLRIIEQAKDSNELHVTAENRLKAKRKIGSLYWQMMRIASEMTYSISVDLLDSEEDWGVRLLTNANNDYKFQYNQRLLRDYDDEKLVTMFADHYEFINQKMQMTMPFNYITDMVLMEYLSGYHGKKDYPLSSVFIFKQQVAVAQMSFHRKYLMGRGKRLEDLLIWFYETSLKNKYGYKSGKMKLASEETDAVNKVRSIIPEIESVLKRYDLYANNGCIDEDLLPYYQGVHFTDTKSILSKKYVYAVEECREVLLPIRYLFHPGAIMDKLPAGFKGEHNLFNTIRHCSVSYDEFNEWQRECLDYLIGQDLIKKDINGVLSFSNVGRIAAMYDIYHDKVISYWNHPKIVKDEIDDMLASGILYEETTLFSKPEKDYLNYLLNDKQFTNGPAIRNAYAHGDQPQVDERSHETAYNYLLIVMVCTLLKIKAEFMMKEQMN